MLERDHMILYVVVPLMVGADIADLGELKEREIIAREQRQEALAELETFRQAGYWMQSVEVHCSQYVTCDVYAFERKGDATELEPSGRVLVG